MGHSACSGQQVQRKSLLITCRWSSQEAKYGSLHLCNLCILANHFTYPFFMVRDHVTVINLFHKGFCLQKTVNSFSKLCGVEDSSCPPFSSRYCCKHWNKGSASKWEALLLPFVAGWIALEKWLQRAGEVFPLELDHSATRLRILKVNICFFPGVG